MPDKESIKQTNIAKTKLKNQLRASSTFISAAPTAVKTGTRTERGPSEGGQEARQLDLSPVYMLLHLLPAFQPAWPPPLPHPSLHPPTLLQFTHSLIMNVNKYIVSKQGGKKALFAI